MPKTKAGIRKQFPDVLYVRRLVESNGDDYFVPGRTLEDHLFEIGEDNAVAIYRLEKVGITKSKIEVVSEL